MIGRCLLMIALLASTAHAQPSDPAAQARAAADDGSARFHSNDYLGAVEKFKEAYALDPDPGYLFNIAQAYRQAGDCANAADYYGRFLVEVPNPPNVATIREWHSSQVTCAAARKLAEPEPTVTPPPAPPLTAAAPPIASQPPQRAQQPAGARRNVGVALALAGTSAVAFAVGGYFTWKTGSLADDRDSALASCTLERPCDARVARDYDEDGHRAATLAGVAFAVGGAALIASTLVFALSGRERAPDVAVAASAHGALLIGGFRW
jgi:tetratricopeptide (TPR) repeat protein